MPSFSANPPPEALRCPRCGYDQRGVVETWAESCPLRGCCAECGLDFAWWEVMRPELRLPAWCIEYAEPKRDLPWTAVKTFVASWWPWYFWSRLRISHPIQPRRLILYAACLILAVLLSYIAEQTAVAVRVRMSMDADLQAARGQVRAQIAAAQAGQTISKPGPREMRLALAASGIQMTYRDAVAEALLHPFSNGSRGTIDWPYPIGAVPYPAPTDLHWHVVSAAFRGGTGSPPPFDFWDVRGAIGLIAFWVIVGALLPLSFVLLPFSTRRATVRRRHLARVFIYALFIPACVTTVVLASVGLVAIIPWVSVSRVLLYLAMPLAFGGSAIMLFCWWHAAIKHYLRLPHASAVAFLLLVTCLLVVLLVGMLVSIESYDYG